MTTKKRKHKRYVVFMTIMTVLILTVLGQRLTGKEPSLFGYKLYIVESGSMMPALKINSIIVVKNTSPEKIKVGDIITYNTSVDGSIVSHRVADIGKNNEYFITRGDANNVEDPNPVSKDKIIGKVNFSIPYVGYIFTLLRSTKGMVFLIAIVSVWMIIPPIFKKNQKLFQM